MLKSIKEIQQLGYRLNAEAIEHRNERNKLIDGAKKSLINDKLNEELSSIKAKSDAIMENIRKTYVSEVESYRKSKLEMIDKIYSTPSTVEVRTILGELKMRDHVSESELNLIAIKAKGQPMALSILSEIAEKNGHRLPVRTYDELVADVNKACDTAIQNGNATFVSYADEMKRGDSFYNLKLTEFMFEHYDGFGNHVADHFERDYGYLDTDDIVSQNPVITKADDAGENGAEE